MYMYTNVHVHGKLRSTLNMYVHVHVRISLFCIYMNIHQQKFSPRLFEGSIDSRRYERAIHEILSVKSHFPPIFKTFLPRKFPVIWYLEEGGRGGGDESSQFNTLCRETCIN